LIERARIASKVKTALALRACPRPAPVHTLIKGEEKVRSAASSFLFLELAVDRAGERGIVVTRATSKARSTKSILAGSKDQVGDFVDVGAQESARVHSWIVNYPDVTPVVPTKGSSHRPL